MGKKKNRTPLLPGVWSGNGMAPVQPKLLCCNNSRCGLKAAGKAFIIDWGPGTRSDTATCRGCGELFRGSGGSNGGKGGKGGKGAEGNKGGGKGGSTGTASRASTPTGSRVLPSNPGNQAELKLLTKKLEAQAARLAEVEKAVSDPTATKEDIAAKLAPKQEPCNDIHAAAQNVKRLEGLVKGKLARVSRLHTELEQAMADQAALEAELAAAEHAHDDLLSRMRKEPAPAPATGYDAVLASFQSLNDTQQKEMLLKLMTDSGVLSREQTPAEDSKRMRTGDAGVSRQQPAAAASGSKAEPQASAATANVATQPAPFSPVVVPASPVEPGVNVKNHQAGETSETSVPLSSPSQSSQPMASSASGNIQSDAEMADADSLAKKRPISELSKTELHDTLDRAKAMIAASGATPSGYQTPCG